MAPGLFPAAFREPEGTVAVYFETAAVITVLVLLGKVLEEGVLQIAASVETASEHPLARAIVDAASRRGIAGRRVGLRFSDRQGASSALSKVLPDQKSAVVERLRREGRVVAMVEAVEHLKRKN